MKTFTRSLEEEVLSATKGQFEPDLSEIVRMKEDINQLIVLGCRLHNEISERDLITEHGRKFRNVLIYKLRDSIDEFARLVNSD